MSKLDRLKKELRERIQSGRFALGQRLVETQLMAEFGVSRHLVREALQALAESRLVEIRHNTGAAVRRLERSDIVNLYNVREPLEGMAARLCAERANAADRTALANLTAALDAATEAQSPRNFVDLNAQFHSKIIAAAGNDELAELIDRLRIPIMRFQFLTLIDRDVIRRSQEDHRKIARAILTDNGDAAETAMRQHIRNSLDLVLDELEADRAKQAG